VREHRGASGSASPLRSARRRRWLASALGVASGAVLLPRALAAQDASASKPIPPAPSPRYVTTARLGVDDHRLVLLDERGQVLHQQPLPARAHGAATLGKRGLGCVFARRPGNWFCALDARRPDTLHTVAALPGRRFSGHGVYSLSGSRLYTTENDIDRQRGVIGVYDVDDGYRRVGEFDSGGIGPHELIRLRGTDRLVVANGGIATHPDVGEGREPLNLADMAPSLAVIDGRDGRGESQHRLPDARHRISLRHLTADAGGRVWYAGQYGRLADDDRPLPVDDTQALAGSMTLGNHARTGRHRALQPLALPDDLLPRHQGYLSSVASAGEDVLYTAARDGVAFAIDAKRRQLVDRQPFMDCSGVAHDAQGGYVVSSGTGELARLSSDGRWLDREPLAMTAFRWDNHLCAF